MSDIYVFFHNKKYVCFFEGTIDVKNMIQALTTAFGYIEEKISCVKFQKDVFDLFHRENDGLMFAYEGENIVAIKNVVVKQPMLLIPDPSLDPENYRNNFSEEDFQKIIENHNQWVLDSKAPILHNIIKNCGEQDVVIGTEIHAILKGEYVVI